MLVPSCINVYVVCNVNGVIHIMHYTLSGFFYINSNGIEIDNIGILWVIILIKMSVIYL